MTERETIKNIIERLNMTIYQEDDDFIEFQSGMPESLIIEFDENGSVTAIY